MNLRRLKYFVKIVDLGSLSQAAEVLYIAQPALSQQMATLEHELGQPLLVRLSTGVAPTEAGRVLYRHAQLILRQVEQAANDVRNSGRSLTGQVSVGLAPGTAASALALPLLKTVRTRHPDVVLHLSEDLGTTLCERVQIGLMDMAVLYSGRQVTPGLRFEPLLTEELVLVATGERVGEAEQVAFADLGAIDLILPRPHNYLRRYVDEVFAQLQLAPRVVAEIESAAALSSAVAGALGATILPASAARVVATSIRARICRIVAPTVEVPLALCTSDRLPSSEPAQVVRGVVMELIDGLASEFDRPKPGLP